MEKNTLSVLVDNSSGVLARIAGLFSRRGFNIESLAVGETQDSDVSRITLIVPCDERVLYQVVEQLRKLQCVRAVDVLSPEARVARELLLLKVHAGIEERNAVIQVAGIFRARIIDVCRDSITLELTGETDKTIAFIDLMNDYGILEMARTGMVALKRGAQTIYEIEKENE